jgi:hypothetical protein
MQRTRHARGQTAAEVRKLHSSTFCDCVVPEDAARGAVELSHGRSHVGLALQKLHRCALEELELRLGLCREALACPRHHLPILPLYLVHLLQTAAVRVLESASSVSVRAA